MKRSVFLRLFGITIVAAICVNIVLGVGLRMLMPPPPRDGRDFMGRAMDFYLRSLAEELGPSPTRAAVTALSLRSRVAIRVETAAGVITTDETLPNYATALRSRPPRHRRPDDDASDKGGGNESDRDRGFGPGPRPPGLLGLPFMRLPPPPPLFALESGGARYVFAPPYGLQREERPELIIVLIAAVTTIILLGYLAIRRLLQPVRWLMSGVVALGEGRLDHRIPVRGHDEFSELARTFNATAARIHAMIQAKEQLLIDVSHELRSPMGRMRVAVELLDDPKGRGRLTSNLSELEHMVQGLLESARLDRDPNSLHREDVDLVDLVGSFCEVYADLDPGVNFSAPNHPVVASVDRDRILSVLRNLIDNALKYSPPAAGTVTVEVENIAGTIEIRVRDHGIGIPEGEIDRVFEPFYRIDKSRSKSTGGGFGLGLSLCQKIAIAHGGELLLTSVLGRGTTALVRLPASVPAVA